MKTKTILALVGTALIAVGALVIWTSPGGLKLGAVEIGGSQRGWLSDRSFDFLEDLQFKDFEKASTYHLAETQKKRDIPTMIRRIFGIKHELLDIQDYKILDVDLDRSGARARVKVLVNYHVLGDESSRDSTSAFKSLELMLYWFKQADASWAMELESSLRS
ncbi:MAG: hypothetical protein U1E65_29390 [Myxococcota bacterium]